MAVVQRGTPVTKAFAVSYPVNTPTGLATDDILYVWVENNTDANVRSFAGMTAIVTETRGSVRMTLLRGVMGGSPPSSITLTNGVANDVVVVFAFSGGDVAGEVVGTPLNVAGNGGNRDIPGITVADDDSFLFAAVLDSGGNPTIGSLTAMASQGSITIRGNARDAGATGAQTITHSNPWTSVIIGVLVAVAPASSGVTGSGSPTLQRATGAGAGQTGNTGSSATTLVRATAAGVGSTGVTGSGAPTLIRATGAGAGQTGNTGSSATTLVRATAIGAGSTTSAGTNGSGAPTTTRATATGSGSTTVPATSGTGAPATARATAAGSGSTGNTGTGSPTCTRATAVGVGSTGLTGSAAVTIVRHTPAGSGSTSLPSSASGSGAPTLVRATVSGSGSTGTSGSGAPTLVRHTIVGVYAAPVTGTGALTLAGHSASGAGRFPPPPLTWLSTRGRANHIARGSPSAPSLLAGRR